MSISDDIKALVPTGSEFLVRTDESGFFVNIHDRAFTASAGRTGVSSKAIGKTIEGALLVAANKLGVTQ